ncbi:Chitin synthesis Congo red RCR protein [Rutstroemia sp. NJR-2017a WRK4]|nr:Chitin synthesis Congo red RCR protein [Rutstroemia sp. NJR-2017a WRK4]
MVYSCDGFGTCYRTSTWDNWGRWVALAVIVVAFILLAFALSCINSRRRRRRGVAPMYGTAWMAAPPPYGQQQHYPNQPYNGAHAPPMYTPPGVVPQQTGNTFNSNDGYYGHHQYQGQNNGNGIELQQPASAYQRGGENVYQPPTGPPPGKKAQGDGIIR